MANMDKVIYDIFGNQYLDDLAMGFKTARLQASSGGTHTGPVADEYLTPRRVVTHALTRNYQDETEVSATAKNTRGELAVRFIDQETPKISKREYVLISELVAKLYTPLIVHRTLQALQEVVIDAKDTNIIQVDFKKK